MQSPIVIRVDIPLDDLVRFLTKGQHEIDAMATKLQAATAKSQAATNRLLDAVSIKEK